jgi:hypothetical protein
MSNSRVEDGLYDKSMIIKKVIKKSIRMIIQRKCIYLKQLKIVEEI